MPTVTPTKAHHIDNHCVKPRARGRPKKDEPTPEPASWLLTLTDRYLETPVGSEAAQEALLNLRGYVEPQS